MHMDTGGRTHGAVFIRGSCGRLDVRKSRRLFLCSQKCSLGDVVRVKCAAAGGNAVAGSPVHPRRGGLDHVSLLDREAEAGCRRKSHDGACTVRGKVTLIIHEQACKPVSIL